MGSLLPGYTVEYKLDFNLKNVFAFKLFLWLHSSKLKTVSVSVFDDR